MSAYMQLCTTFMFQVKTMSSIKKQKATAAVRCCSNRGSNPCSNPDVMMEAYSQEKASPLFFIVYLVVTVYFISNIVSFTSSVTLYSSNIVTFSLNFVCRMW